MKRANRFTVPSNWKLMLSDMQIDVNAGLQHAQLPADLFNRQHASLTPAEYYRLWRGMEQAAGDREIALLLAENFSAEAFDAPIFASLCSPDLNTAVERLRHYKPLIGPMNLGVDKDDTATTLTIECYGYDEMVPKTLGLCELVFFNALARLATRERIVPIALTLPRLPDNLPAYTEYFGCELRKGDSITIAFSAADANKPFLTANGAMWDFFEDKLNRKLADLDATASTGERVRAVLMEALPSGVSSIELVAQKLAMSKRTLQRKLSSESESFQSILIAVRADLADHYLERSHLSLGEISFLLGFQESNSFIRAYSGWKGISPGQYREQCH